MDKVCQANGNNKDKTFNSQLNKLGKESQSQPPKNKEENNNEDKCRNNEVEVKKCRGSN